MIPWDPYGPAQALITCCLDSNPDEALTLFDEIITTAEAEGDAPTNRLAQLALALTEIATTLHLAWAGAVGLDRADALGEWASMIAAVNLARMERDGNS